MSHLKNEPWAGLPPHNTTSTAPKDAALLGTIPLDPQHTRQPGIWARAGHLVGTYRRLQPDDTDRDQDHQPGLLLQKSKIYRGVTGDKHTGCGYSTGVCVPGCPGLILGMGCRGDELPQAEGGELQVHQRKKTYPNHRCIPPSLQLGSPTGLLG